MKTPLTSQSVGRKAIIINPKIMKKINRTAKVQNFSQKTAESCVNLIFLTTFAKKLKDRELWQKLKRQRLATLCLMTRISTSTRNMA